MERFKLSSIEITSLIKKYYKEKKGKRVIVKSKIEAAEPLMKGAEFPVTVVFFIREEGEENLRPMPEHIFYDIISDISTKAEFDPQGVDFTYLNGDFTITVTGHKKNYGQRQI